MSLHTSTDAPLRAASLGTAPAAPDDGPVTLPWLREPAFGNSLGVRLAALVATAAGHLCGPSDLVHWGRHYGERLSRFTHDDFALPRHNGHLKEEDGYVGYVHYCNGLDYSRGAPTVEQYATAAIGLVRAEHGYVWRPDVDLALLGTYHHRQMVVSVCSYNAFARAELRARFVVAVGKSRRRPVAVDALYVVHSQVLKKLHTYSQHNIADVPAAFWDELAVSTAIRLCVHTDDPTHQLCGTVNSRAQTESRRALAAAVLRMVALLPRGHLAGTRECFGVASGCGADASSVRYRNRLVDALVRFVLLDASGAAADHALAQLAHHAAHEFDYVECQVLKLHQGRNNDQRFLALVHAHLRRAPTLTQAALLLVEQVRFLVAKGSYVTATKLAARAVAILPLDFDCWFHLALCYVLANKYDIALETINSFPLVFSKNNILDSDSVDGIYDAYAMSFMEGAVRGKSIDLRAFESSFPPPKLRHREEGSIEKLWHSVFHYNPHLRHPISGPFHQSPLSSATPLEISAVDSSIMKVGGLQAKKYLYASQSTGLPWASVLDFDRKSTWGRTYDLLTLIVAFIGWDNLVHLKTKAFLSADVEITKDYTINHEKPVQPECEAWLQLMFLVIYEDIRVMMLVSDQTHDRSALAWEMIGFTGWGCKYNLKDSISSLVTSVAGVSADGKFDYFGTVKLLEIYDEFVLSDVTASTIDPLSSPYDHRSYTNKLIVQRMSPKIHQEFVDQLMDGYFTLENVLLYLLKLVSWNLRWHSYMPNYLVTNILTKLCIKFDSVHVRATLQMMFEKHKKQVPKAQGNFTLRTMFAAPTSETQQYEFAANDTIIDYMNGLLSWFELLQEGADE